MDPGSQVGLALAVDLNDVCDIPEVDAGPSLVTVVLVDLTQQLVTVNGPESLVRPDPHDHDRPALATPVDVHAQACLLYTSPSPRDRQKSRMPSSA